MLHDPCACALLHFFSWLGGGILCQLSQTRSFAVGTRRTQLLTTFLWCWSSLLCSRHRLSALFIWTSSPAGPRPRWRQQQQLPQSTSPSFSAPSLAFTTALSTPQAAASASGRISLSSLGWRSSRNGAGGASLGSSAANNGHSSGAAPSNNLRVQHSARNTAFDDAIGDEDLWLADRVRSLQIEKHWVTPAGRRANFLFRWLCEKKNGESPLCLLHKTQIVLLIPKWVCECFWNGYRFYQNRNQNGLIHSNNCLRKSCGCCHGIVSCKQGVVEIVLITRLSMHATASAKHERRILRSIVRVSYDLVWNYHNRKKHHV